MYCVKVVGIMTLSLSRIRGKVIVRLTVILLILMVSSSSLSLLGMSVSGDGSAAVSIPDRSKSATDLPSAPSSAAKVVVNLVTMEALGQLANGVTYTFWTFNGTVPGPFIRIRLGQVVEMHIKNPATAR